MRSTPLAGSTFSIESAVCSVIFLIVSGRASQYSDMTKSHVFGGALMILMTIFGNLLAITFRYSPNQSFSLSSLCGGCILTTPTPRSFANVRTWSNCFLVSLRSGAESETTGRSIDVMSESIYPASQVSYISKSTDRSIPSYPDCFARENILCRPYPASDEVERRSKVMSN